VTGMAGQGLPLQGRVALITGVSRRAGIGYSIARELLSLGADCFLQSWSPHDREQPWGADHATVDEVIGSLRKNGRRIDHGAVDLAQRGAPEELFRRAVKSFDHVDILVLNHARSSKQALEELTWHELDLCFRINAIASLLLVRQWTAHHEDARPGGRAIVLSSGQHLGPMTGELPYAASKAGIVGIVESLAFHLAPRGLTVNAVNPGPTDTGWADEDTHARVLEQMPFGRWGKPEDAARLIGWLCTDEGGWITGQIINSEGGFRRFRR
jgi:3-oxoacyl-[acyl-carrier protein] reductase